MKPTAIFSTAGLALFLCWQGTAQIYDTNNVVVQTFAGSGFSGHVDGVGQQTMFNNPRSIVADSAGSLFVIDSGNYRIRKIVPDGTVTTFVGGGGSSLPGYGTNVCLNCGFSSPPWNGFGSLAIDRSNVLWMAVYQGGGLTSLLRIQTNSYVSSVLENPQNTLGFSYASGICTDSINNLYYSRGGQGVSLWSVS